MSMHQGIDLSRFKKVAGDKQSTTLRHSKGHEIKVAHKGLTDKMREHLNGMPVHLAEEGDVPEQIPAAADPAAMDPSSPATADDTPAPAQSDASAPAPTDAAPAPTASNPDVSPDGTVNVVGQKPISSPYLKAQDAGIQNDFAMGHIKPETYQDLFAKKDTLGKIGTIFGLIVGGAGAGLTHQPNAVLEMMKNEIQNDLQGQVHSNENAQNFYRLNQQQQMNDATMKKMVKEGKLTEAQAALAKQQRDTGAYALANIQTNRAAFHSLVMQVNKLPIGSPERQEAEQKLAMMNNAIDKENYSIADRAAAQSALAHAVFNKTPEGQKANGGGDTGEQNFQDQSKLLRMSGNVPLADDRDAKHMPGIDGQASVPLTPDDRNKIMAGQSFQRQLADFIHFTKGHSGDLKPADEATGRSKAAMLNNSYRQATGGGVYKGGEADFINQIIDDDPTKFFNKIRVLPKLMAVQKESAAQLNDRVNGYSPPLMEGDAGKASDGRTWTVRNGKRMYDTQAKK